MTFYYKNPCEKPLKAWFPDVYQGKTHIKCYNFFQQGKNHFAIAGTTELNRVLFAPTFLKNIVLFCKQQYRHKIKDKTNIFIT